MTKTTHKTFIILMFPSFCQGYSRAIMVLCILGPLPWMFWAGKHRAHDHSQDL